MRLWGGRFGEENDPRVADFTRSIEIDRELADDDLLGSIAHVRGLGRAGLLTPDEVRGLVEGLEALRADVAGARMEWDPSLEDVHLNLEAALEARIGPLAGKLHTGRSRNDQVATDLRLWTRRAIDRLDAGLLDLERALVGLAEREPDAAMPGTTHIQPAQPVLFAHHVLAHVEALERDRARLVDARRRVNISPLGSGALAGAGFPLDREATAADLGFDGVTANSIDAVGDRDFVVETLAAIALAMVHLSRLAEEITWWSNPAFGWVRVADAFSTGSSMMPNKRNPDPAELVRGRAARVTGSLAGMLTLLKGLPLGYQRDLQEDKLPVFEAVKTLESSLGVLSGLVATLRIDATRMRAAAEDGYTTATSVADALVRAGIPFRTAHGIVGGLVARAETAGIRLGDLPAEAFSDALQGVAGGDDLTDTLRGAATVEIAIEGADVVGGTAPRRVREALATVRRRLDASPSGEPDRAAHTPPSAAGSSEAADMFRDTRAFSGFSVDDVEKVRPFYADTLGVDTQVRNGMLELHFGETAVLVYPKGEAHEPATFTVLNFPVADIDRAVDELIARGVEFERYGDEAGQDEKGIARRYPPPIAWFRDPAGNILSVIEQDA